MTKPLGLRKDETIRSIAAKGQGYFLLIVLISVVPAFLEGFDTNLFQFGAPYIVSHIHAPTAMLGVMATGYAVGIALFSIVGGFLFDKFSVKYTVLLSIAIFAVFTLLSGLANSTALLIIARLLVGVGVGMFQPAIIAFLGDIFPNTRGRAVSAFAVFFGGGVFVGPYLITPFLPHFQIPFVISFIVSVLSLLAFYLFIPKTYEKIEKHKIGMKGVMNRNVAVLSISIFFFGITLFGFLGYYSDYLLKGLSISSGLAASIASMGGLGGFICAFPIGLLADKVGRRHIVKLAALLILIGSVGMFTVGSSSIALFILTFAFGAGWGMFVDLIATLAQDSVEENVAGTATGLIFLVFNVGAILGGPVFAALLPLGFVKAGLVTLGVSSLLSFVLAFLLRKETIVAVATVTMSQPVEQGNS